MITNCINCGAPLQSKKCEYCGTDYSGKFESQISDEWFGTLTYKGNTYQVYMDECVVNYECGECYRDFNGVLHRTQGVKKRKFTLIEY